MSQVLEIRLKFLSGLCGREPSHNLHHEGFYAPFSTTIHFQEAETLSLKLQLLE